MSASPAGSGRAGPTIRSARAVAALLALLALAGCGFRPLYGTRSVDPRVATELASVYVEPIADREGQLVHNAIQVRLNPGGDEKNLRYRLQVGINIIEAQAVVSSDQTATQANVTYNATYALYEGATLLTTGNFVRDFSYDYLSEQYSNISAQADIKRRAADEIATEMRNRMAAYFIRAAKARAAEGAPPAPVTAQ